jgi:hypothetical protein
MREWWEYAGAWCLGLEVASEGEDVSSTNESAVNFTVRSQSRPHVREAQGRYCTARVYWGPTCADFSPLRPHLTPEIAEDARTRCYHPADTNRPRLKVAHAMAHAPSSVDVLALAPGTAAVRSIAALLALRPDGVPVDPGVAPALAAVLGDLRGLAAALRDAEAPWWCARDGCGGQGGGSARATADARRLVDALARLRAAAAPTLSGGAYARTAASVAPAGAPLALPLALLHPAGAAAAGGAGGPRGRDATEHQAARDVERDALAVNGVPLPGAALGYTGVLAAVIALARRAEGAAFGGGGGARADDNVTLQAALLSRSRAVAVALLRAANRTVSGGDGYDAASRVFASGGGGGGGDAFLVTARQHLRRLVEDARRARAASSGSGGDVGCGAIDVDAASAANVDGWGWDDDDDDGGGGGGGIRSGRGNAAPALDDHCGGPAVLLVADSKAAPPIEITIDVGPFQPAGAQADGSAAAAPDALARAGLTRADVALADECAAWTVGLRATIRAVTVYRLLDASPQQQQPAAAAAAGGRPHHSTTNNNAHHHHHPSRHPDGLLGRVTATYVRRLGWAPEFLAAPLLQAALARAQQRQLQQQHAGAGVGVDAPAETDPDRLLQRLCPEAADDGDATVDGSGDDAERRHLLLWRHIDAQLGLGRAGAPASSDAAAATAAAAAQQPPYVPPLAALAREAVASAAASAAAMAASLPLLPVVCGDGGHVELTFTPAGE